MGQQDLPCNPPSKNDRGWVGSFFLHRCLLSSATKTFFPKEKVDFVEDIRTRTAKYVVFRHNHSNPISTKWY